MIRAERAKGIVLAGFASLAVSGCAWQGYAASRGVRLVTGARTQVHTIAAVTAPLSAYQVIEMRPLESLLPGRLPSDLERYLNDRLAQQLHQLPSYPVVERVDPDPWSVTPEERRVSSVPTLIFEGVIDDYDPGYVGLRLAELGFNHFVLTVRFECRDKDTGRIVAAASVTAQDDRAIARGRPIVDRLAGHVRHFIEAGYVR